MLTHLYTILFTVGVLLGITFGETSSFSTFIFILSIVLVVVYAPIVYIRIRALQKAFVSTCLLLFCIGIAFGIVRIQFLEERQLIHCEDVCTLEGLVKGIPLTQDDTQIIDIEVDQEAYLVRIRTTLYPKYENGDLLSVEGTTKLPGYIFPHAEEKGFDYASYLKTRGVGSEMVYPAITIISSDATSLTSRLAVLRNQLEEKIYEYVGGVEGVLASGMLLGSVSFSEEQKESFRVAGLSHIVVLSGFNITILIACLLLFLKPLPLVIRILGAFLGSILFVIMVGASPPLVRATLMASFTLLALLFGRPYIARQALLLSLLIISITHPVSVLYDASLHLSFLATAGIVYLYPSVVTLVYRLPPFIREIFASSLCAYVATLPYVMYMFGSLSVYGLLSNTVALPFVPLTMLLTVFTLLVSFISPYGALIVGYGTHFFASWILVVSHVVERLPFASLQVSITETGMYMMYVAILMLVILVSFLSTKPPNETQETKQDIIESPIIRF